MLEDTLLGLIVKNADEMADEVAIREKRYGVWSPMTWRQFYIKVQRFALGLRVLGFEEGNHLAIIGDNKPEWVIAEFGCMAADGIPTGAYPDSLAEEMEYLITFSDAVFSGGPGPGTGGQDPGHLGQDQRGRQKMSLSGIPGA